LYDIHDQESRYLRRRKASDTYWTYPSRWTRNPRSGFGSRVDRRIDTTAYQVFFVVARGPADAVGIRPAILFWRLMGATSSTSTNCTQRFKSSREVPWCQEGARGRHQLGLRCRKDPDIPTMGIMGAPLRRQPATSLVSRSAASRRNSLSQGGSRFDPAAHRKTKLLSTSAIR
jgi:hypothetical protein